MDRRLLDLRRTEEEDCDLSFVQTVGLILWRGIYLVHCGSICWWNFNTQRHDSSGEGSNDLHGTKGSVLLRVLTSIGCSVQAE